MTGPSRFPALVALTLALSACGDPPRDAVTEVSARTPSLSASDAGTPLRQYGSAVRVGNGEARAYIEYDRAGERGSPIEIGMSFDAKSLDGLSAPTTESRKGGHLGHSMLNEFLLPLPKRNPTPYRLLALNWNPAGHEPPGIYDIPHFDFHFYVISLDERNAIEPSDPLFQAKADHLPAPEYVAPGFLNLPPPPAPASAVPMMGVHFSDLSSPELQPPSSPNHATFTRTFIYGSWDGNVIFEEPMITVDYLRTKPDGVFPIAMAQRYTPAGYYPSAYRVTYDAKRSEYRIGLSNLVWRS